VDDEGFGLSLGRQARSTEEQTACCFHH
jgi:hypothetical protein